MYSCLGDQIYGRNRCFSILTSLCNSIAHPWYAGEKTGTYETCQNAVTTSLHQARARTLTSIKHHFPLLPLSQKFISFTLWVICNSYSFVITFVQINLAILVFIYVSSAIIILELLGEQKTWDIALSPGFKGTEKKYRN